MIMGPQGRKPLAIKPKAFLLMIISNFPTDYTLNMPNDGSIAMYLPRYIGEYMTMIARIRIETLLNPRILLITNNPY
jgi:hypothetical protein